jgi:hydroxymethylpyrimidine pyrophosphatase-like HAD family hydrolase
MSDRQKPLIIAVDFDGTIVEHRYPEIGEIIPSAFEVLQELQENGHKLILWTFRDGEYLKEAVDFCLDNGIMFYAINESSPNEEFNKYMSRKINADIFIDDRNVGGFIGWENIRRILIPNSPLIKKEKTKSEKPNTEKSLLKKLFG